MENNEIYSNTGAGVFVQDEGSEATLRDNRIYNGKDGGVFINFQAKATLENNEIMAKHTGKNRRC